MQEKDKVGQDVQQGEQNGEQPQNAMGREMEGEGMSSTYSGMGDLNPGDVETADVETDNLTAGDHTTGETATMTTPGNSKTDDGASEGHRISGEDNRQ